MHILVTGGAGYLGSALTQLLLRNNHQVRVFDSLMNGANSAWAFIGLDGCEFMRGDIRDADAVARSLEGVDAVVHLAAIVGDPACARDPRLTRAVNLHASLDLIAAAERAGATRFVFASTCSNYGRLADGSSPATEDFELRPLSLYAETKVAVEQRLRDSPSSMEAVVLRFATLYGLSPRMRFDLTVNEFVLSLLVDRRLVVYGEQFWRPYVHVRDAARAIELALTAPEEKIRSRVFNVGDTRENYRKSDLVDIIRRRTGEAEIEFIHKAEDPRDYKVACDRIASALGFHITRRVPDGVEEIARAIEAGIVETPKAPHHYNVAPGLVRAG
jgi:nucleoside-diphosphate-sugar epimerase